MSDRLADTEAPGQKPDERALSADEIRETIASMLGVDKARVRIVLGSPFGVAVTVPRREYESARKQERKLA